LEHGISKSTVQRLWETFQLAPHRHESFKLSTDAHFVEKVVDVTGLYLSPPDKALVLVADEKSQCQAHERTQPALPSPPNSSQPALNASPNSSPSCLGCAMPASSVTVDT
jgi:hypothetical protein